MNNVPKARTRLLDIFPPPRYLELPSVGLDISDRSLKFLELIRVGQTYKLGRFGDRPMSSGIIAGGVIIDEKAFTEQLSELRRSKNLYFVRASLPEEKAYIFRTMVPNVAPSEIRSNLEFQLEENVPLSLAESVFNFDVISPAQKSGFLNVAVTVFPKQLVDSYLACCADAGLMPISLEIEPQVSARAVIKRGDAGTYLVMDFGRTRTGLSVISHGSVVFASTVDIGGDLIDDAIVKHTGLSLAEAEQGKKERGFLRTRVNAGTVSIMAGIMSVLKDEIGKHLSYWNTHVEKEEGTHAPIQALILCGGGAALPGLVSHFSDVFSVSVRRANVWTNISFQESYVPEIPSGRSLGYATSIGLALGNDF